jgi:DNA-binding FadR family transcriptional regulator
MPHSDVDSDIRRYIVKRQLQPGDRLPTIIELSQELGVSASKIREELAVARTLGWVQIKPRTGTQMMEFDFGPAVTLSALYALSLNPAFFQDFSQLRQSVELSFWREAVAQLTPEDIAELRRLVICAREKLNRVPIEVPFQEHRRLHLAFFKHLENPFAQGILDAYWTIYRAFGLALYAELSYHREVWDYHDRMVECVARRDVDGSYQALRDHMDLLRYRPEEVREAEQEASDNSSGSQHFFE